ncbi:MAG: membrane protein insertion efficiency factor YidD [bacterium]
MVKKILVFLIVLSLCVNPLSAQEKEEFKPLTWIFQNGIKFFMKFLTKYDGPRCPHSPTCSLYTYKNIANYGFLKGWTMGAARRLRCSPYTMQWNLPVRGSRLYDPPETTCLWSEKERRKITPLSP